MWRLQQYTLLCATIIVPSGNLYIVVLTLHFCWCPWRNSSSNGVSRHLKFAKSEPNWQSFITTHCKTVSLYIFLPGKFRKNCRDNLLIGQTQILSILGKNLYSELSRWICATKDQAGLFFFLNMQIFSQEPGASFIKPF